MRPRDTHTHSQPVGVARFPDRAVVAGLMAPCDDTIDGVFKVPYGAWLCGAVVARRRCRGVVGRWWRVVRHADVRTLGPLPPSLHHHTVMFRVHHSLWRAVRLLRLACGGVRAFPHPSCGWTLPDIQGCSCSACLASQCFACRPSVTVTSSGTTTVTASDTSSSCDRTTAAQQKTGKRVCISFRSYKYASTVSSARPTARRRCTATSTNIRYGL
jgi:hypothetical protein